MTTKTDRTLIDAAAAYNAKCTAAVDEICARGPMAARRACDDLIARRIEHDRDVTNLMSSMIRGLKAANVSTAERVFFDIAIEVLGEAQDEIVKRHRANRNF